MTYTEIKILNSKEKQGILNLLNDQFGITEIPGELFQIGKERLFFFQGDIKEKDFEFLQKILPVEKIGTYIAKIMEIPQGKIIRLSIEGAQIFQNQITKNIFTINDEQMEQWMMGRELPIETNLRGFIAIKYKNELLGTGKASENKVTNFIPKNRRLKDKAN